MPDDISLGFQLADLARQVLGFFYGGVKIRLNILLCGFQADFNLIEILGNHFDDFFFFFKKDHYHSLKKTVLNKLSLFVTYNIAD